MPPARAMGPRRKSASWGGDRAGEGAAAGECSTRWQSGRCRRCRRGGAGTLQLQILCGWPAPRQQQQPFPHTHQQAGRQAQRQGPDCMVTLASPPTHPPTHRPTWRASSWWYSDPALSFVTGLAMPRSARSSAVSASNSSSPSDAAAEPPAGAGQRGRGRERQRCWWLGEVRKTAEPPAAAASTCTDLHRFLHAPCPPLQAAARPPARTAPPPSQCVAHPSPAPPPAP